jgi:Fur family transcriptional regulator, ferric uptake regulator
MVAGETIVSTLQKHGYRITAPRRGVARLIAERQGHFTAEDLMRSSRRQRAGLGRATVFRSLELLTSLDLVERVDLPSGEHAYVTCEPTHHHHLVCSSCGRAVGVEEGDLDLALQEIGRRTGYQIDSHRLELFGLCANCQPAQS